MNTHSGAHLQQGVLGTADIVFMVMAAAGFALENARYRLD